jgi:hypothetical protein
VELINKEANMSKLSTEERIRRIEMAPAEMQVKIAKAYLREDIDDEDVQYLYNEDPIDVLVEDGEVENDVYAENN